MWAGLMGALSRLFGSRLGQWILGAMAVLGITLATQQFVVEPFLQMIQNAISGAPSLAVRVIAYIGFDIYVTATLTAYATAAGMNALKLRKKAT